MTDPRQDDPPPPGPGHPSSRQVNSLVRLLEGESGSGPSRILSLGTDAPPLAAALRERGHQVVEPPPDEAETALGVMAGSSPGTLDAVLALGFVERLRWDRWALQRIHYVLKDGGTLLLVVPDLYSLRSLADPRYVAAKLAKITRLRLGGNRAAPAGGGVEAVRSYPSGRLRTTLERLGYEPRRWSRLGLPPARDPAAGGRWPPTHHLVVARKRTAAADPAGEARRFDAENRAFVALRERWRRELMPAGEAPRALEPERFAGAHVLVLAPHPDDELVGCGGTLLRLVQAGARVTVLQATDGSASAALDQAPPAIARTIRLAEARAVAKAAGFEPPILWSEDNRAFRARDDLAARLRETLREIGPALVFTPFVADIHPDHQTLNRILARALAGLPERETSVLGYEVWSLAPANRWCDVTSCTPELERLFLLYETAMKVDDLVRMSSARNRRHALALGRAPGYAEAFFAAEAGRFRGMVERQASSAPSR